ncbi:SDR family oxidoreductase [Alteromonas pelagimontana]|uniref:SDR family oxidoreductase n=1 Tax=Alteromonas pelagimontana TaxID=1858656 RepID=A0A6M4MBR5_9ALTE|nr:UDP-glucuronic acid decarboxylase family protein [Alteromonas pelagimontana]QJR80583.1 SDR family oxidoreductase [Alteromonas pelagimontana]
MAHLKKRVLIAGGAGFIGTNLSHRLLRDGYKVFCVDNFSSGTKANLSSHENFFLLEQDVAQPIDIDVDWIFNLACCASPVQYQADPLQTIRTNTLGVANLLTLARNCNATLLQASTSEVYGNPSVHPQTEDYFGNVNPIGPRACYDEGKRCAEATCMDFHRTYGTPVKIARIFNTYGPGMQPDDGRVISNFIVQALKNEPITVYGDGSQTRSFCFVDDLVEGLLALMFSPSDFVGPVNLGNPGEFTVEELAHQVIAMTGSTSEIVYHPLPTDDPVRRKPDINRAKEALGWKPRIPLEKGLKSTISYFDDLLAVKSAVRRDEEPVLMPIATG